jgi:hypothetical protein
MPTAAGVSLLIVAICIVIAAVVQVFQYLRGRQLITRTQLILRVINAGLLLLAIALIFLGFAYFKTNPVATILYWCFAMLLVVPVIILAMVDLRLVDRRKHVEQAAIYRALQELQDEGRAGSKK